MTRPPTPRTVAMTWDALGEAWEGYESVHRTLEDRHIRAPNPGTVQMALRQLFRAGHALRQDEKAERRGRRHLYRRRPGDPGPAPPAFAEDAQEAKQRRAANARMALARPESRLQVAMWLPARCGACLKPYASVDDFIKRNPRAGPGWFDGDEDTRFVDDECWTPAWQERGEEAKAGAGGRPDP